MEAKTNQALDPVCGMTVDPASAQAKVAHAGTTYFFCSPGCAKKFGAAPEQYLKPRPSGLVMLGGPGQDSQLAAPTRVKIGLHEGKNAAIVRDPVCGMKVNPTAAKYRATHEAKEYFFCSASCREKFLTIPAPAAHLEDPKSAFKPAPAGTVYVCPMCPEVHESNPVPCRTHRHPVGEGFFPSDGR